MPSTLKTHAFRVVLANVTELTDALEDALLEAGCDDAGLGSCEGVVTIDFEREGDALGDAVGSALRAVERAGFKVARIEVEPADD